jgi:hypothetical protein
MKCTPELVTSIGHDYQHELKKSVRRIATDHGVSLRTVNTLIEREGWPLRRDRERDRQRDLPEPMRLLRQASALVAARAAAGAGSAPHDVPAIADAPAMGVEPASPDHTATIERLARLVERELAAEEAMRAQLGALARPPAEAERCARTLAALTQTLHALQRLRCGLVPDTGADRDDDFPRDLDEFRLELARRIDAFIESRADDADAGGDQPARVDAVG